MKIVDTEFSTVERIRSVGTESSVLERIKIANTPRKPCSECGHVADAHDPECMVMESCTEFFPISEPDGCDCMKYVDPDGDDEE